MVDELLVSRRGFPMDPPPTAPTEEEARRWPGRTRSQEWRLRALTRVYADQEAYADLNALCEVLVEMDECINLWRAHHVSMVERMIGAKRGTGGSEGVGYLRSTLPKRGFPDLWAVRSALGSGYGQAGA